ALTNPKNTVFAVKRLIGRKFRAAEVEQARRYLSYQLSESPNGDVHIQIDDKLYSPPEISAFVLQKLKAAAEDYLGEPVEEAIITCPAYFTDPQRQATKDAGLIAGLKVSRILNEPTAAALAYGLKSARGQFVAVYDLDGGLLVGGQTRGPEVAEVVRRVVGKEPNRAVNPDEGIAMGAAIQTGIIAGEVKELVLLDVTPHTLGIETRDGTFTPLIERNSTIPTRKSRIFTTVADNQTKVEVHILQGESDMAAYNKSLAKFELTNIPPAPKGVPQI